MFSLKIKRIIDIGRKLNEDMAIWPGDQKIQISRDSLIQNGDKCNVSSIKMSVHAGTHVDAPLHFIDSSDDIGKLDLSGYIGYVKVFFINTSEYISLDDVIHLPINRDDIVFFRTRNSELPQNTPFDKSFIYLHQSASEYLASKGIKTIGIDYLSIDKYNSEEALSHNILLSKKIGVIEGLYLNDVSDGIYFFSCLPLNISGSDGAPARAVLIEFE